MRAYVEPLGRDGLTAALNWYRALPWSLREKGYPADHGADDLRLERR